MLYSAPWPFPPHPSRPGLRQRRFRSTLSPKGSEGCKLKLLPATRMKSICAAKLTSFGIHSQFWVCSSGFAGFRPRNRRRRTASRGRFPDPRPCGSKATAAPCSSLENDQGPVADSLKLENISLMFKLTASQQADLTALLEAQQDPSSPNFHQWLTPEQYADRFGLSQNDMNKVVAWLQAQGFEVTQTARGRTWVSFSGTAAQVQAAFQTEIHNFSLDGQTYYANASEPAVPAALADVVLGFHGLDNYPLKPRSVFRQVKTEPKPNFTSGISGNTFVVPGRLCHHLRCQNLYNHGNRWHGAVHRDHGADGPLSTAGATSRLSAVPRGCRRNPHGHPDSRRIRPGSCHRGYRRGQPGRRVVRRRGQERHDHLCQRGNEWSL